MGTATSVFRAVFHYNPSMDYPAGLIYFATLDNDAFRWAVAVVKDDIISELPETETPEIPTAVTSASWGWLKQRP